MTGLDTRPKLVGRRIGHRVQRAPRGTRIVIALLMLTVCAAASGGATAQFTDNSEKGTNGFTTSSLLAPTSPTATVSGSNVTVGWNASVSGIATGTEVYRSTTPGGPYTLLATVSPTSPAAPASEPNGITRWPP